MRGIVIHANGHFRRTLEGRDNEYQLRVEAVTSLPKVDTGGTSDPSRPLHFIFYCDGKSFAGSQRVVLTTGRRYPNVEHWFILPAVTQQVSEGLASQSTLAAVSSGGLRRRIDKVRRRVDKAHRITSLQSSTMEK